MFKLYCTYTHNRMLDAAIYVVDSFYLPDGRYVLKIRWMNRKGLYLNILEKIIIKKQEVKNWYLL